MAYLVCNGTKAALSDRSQSGVFRPGSTATYTPFASACRGIRTRRRCEPNSGTASATARASGFLKPADTVVVFNTGTGLKYR